MKRLIATILITSFLLQPLGLVAPIFAEAIETKYTDPDHLHAPKEVNGVVYQYDENGNLVDDGERVISWNQDNMPTRIEKDGRVVEFFYDANGRRIVKKVGEDKTVYVNQYLAIEQLNNETIPRKYYFANSRVAQEASGNLSFLHQNYLGSTVLATDSNSQALGETLSYFPYGNHTKYEIPNTKYLFTGQEQDPETDLYNYNARLYDPKTGAFISADSIGAGNRYSYAANNPMIFTDPTGHMLDAGGGGDRISTEIKKLIQDLIGKNVGENEREKTNFYVLDFSRRTKQGKEAVVPMSMILKGFQNEPSQALFLNPEFPVGQRVEIFYGSEISREAAFAIAGTDRFDPAWAENTMRWVHENISITSREIDSSFWFSYNRTWDLNEKLDRDLIICFDKAAIFSLVAEYLGKESEVLTLQFTGSEYTERHAVVRLWEQRDNQRTAWIADPTWGYLVEAERWEDFLLETYGAIINWENIDQMVFRPE